MNISRIKAQVTYRLRNGLPLTVEMADYVTASFKELQKVKNKLRKVETEEFLAAEKEKMEKMSVAVIKARITSKVRYGNPLTHDERHFLRYKGGSAYIERLKKESPSYPHW